MEKIARGHNQETNIARGKAEFYISTHGTRGSTLTGLLYCWFI